MTKHLLHPQLNHVPLCICTSLEGSSMAASSMQGGCKGPVEHAAVPVSLLLPEIKTNPPSRFFFPPGSERLLHLLQAAYNYILCNFL